MGGIRIVKETERLVFEGDGFKIFYRRMPAPIRADIIRRNTPRRGGDPDYAKASISMLRYCILGWEGVYDFNESGEREEVEFSKDLIGMLPDSVQADLIDLFGGTNPEMESDIKNSSTSLANKKPIED